MLIYLRILILVYVVLAVASGWLAYTVRTDGFPVWNAVFLIFAALCVSLATLFGVAAHVEKSRSRG